jgi:hypothetical protein
MRTMHGRPTGSGEAATIEDVKRGRPGRQHLQKSSSGESARKAPGESTGIAHRLTREQQGSGRLGRAKD